VIAGPTAAVKQALDLAATRGISGRLLRVSAAFHTPLVAGAREPVAALAGQLLNQAPGRPVYSNLDAAPHPADKGAIAQRLGDHLAGPVRFAEMIEAMHRDGARVFVEVGPGSILTPLIDAVLKDRPHRAVACDAAGSSGLAGWLRALARLVAAGLPLKLESLTRGRTSRLLDLEHLPAGEYAEPLTPSTWLVNGSRARPIAEPEPTRLGQALVGAHRTPESRRLDSADGHSAKKPSTNGTTPHTKTSARLPAARREEHAVGTGPAIPRSSSERKNNLDVNRTMKTNSLLSSSTDRAIESFQETMQAFLEVQKATMLAYLAGQSAPGFSGSPVAEPEVKERHREHSIAAPVTPSRTRTGSDAVTSRNGHAEDHESSTRNGRHTESYGSNGNGYGNGHHNGNGHRGGDGKHLVAQPAALAAAGPDRATITARLLETVRDRTGYPIETLALDLDMEADLGIDSIKRVEILGKLRDQFPGLKALSDSPEMMDAMARARTLGVIVDRMASMAEQSTESTGASPKSIVPAAHAMTNGNGKHDRAPLRRLLKATEAPLPLEHAGLMPGGRIVVTDDGRGLARRLETQLVAAGVAVERIGGPDATIDWTSPAAIEAALDRLRENGPLAGIVHTLPMGGNASSCERIEADWSARVGVEVKGLFLLAKAMAPDLETAARAGGSCLIAATAMGGRMASDGCGAIDFFPGQGGIAGLVKTLAREWPAIRARVVDFSASDPIATVADHLVAEVFASDGWAEVGYDQGSRVRLRSIESPLEHVSPTLELKPGDPVVISGGGRGITALAAAELARLWRPTLLIVGTTPLPVDGESADTRSLTAEAEIKAALHARLRDEGKPASPAQIETAYQVLRRTREVRENLENLRKTGATVDYAGADVRDPAALARVLNGWRARHGEVAGLIHGAGLIKDKLIRQKSVESFDRVLETKLDGALNLIRLVRGDSLKFTALFSSIAGRFGNVGQSDYAAANEILSKLAHWLDRRWPGRVVSLIWGPWSGIGMVSQLESHLGSRGLGMISPESGGSLLANELRYGQKGEVEVIYSGELGTLELPAEPVAERVEAFS
jgi:KR domain/Enoyl-(Acyl carrier protein) reductase/Phosphopantetheine attachment site